MAATNEDGAVFNEMAYTTPVFGSFPEDFNQDVGKAVADLSFSAVRSLQQRLRQEFPDVDPSKIEASCNTYLKNIDYHTQRIFDDRCTEYCRKNLLVLSKDTVLPQDQVCLETAGEDQLTPEHVKELEEKVEKARLRNLVLKDEIRCLEVTEPLLLSLSTQLESHDESVAGAITESRDLADKLVSHLKSLSDS